jgi:general nucleoside transport system permease protein
VGVFVQNISAGQGYIALAAVIFGGWRVWGVFGACLVFAGTNAMQLRLQDEESVPPAVWVVVAIVAGAALAWRLREPQQHRARATGWGGVLVAAALVLAVVRPAFTLPSELWLALPYVVALLAVAGLVGRVRMPSSLGTPYQREASDS